MDILGLSCIFPVPNIKRTAEYYMSNLGFSAVEYLNCEEHHICLYLDQVEIILLQANTDRILPNRELYGYGYDAYLYTDKQEVMEKAFISKGVIPLLYAINANITKNKSTSGQLGWKFFRH